MLELSGLTVRFGGLTAVDGVTLSMAEGEILGLLGPNGAGKTTLFNAVSGLVRPSEGGIRFHDRNIVRTPLHRRAQLGIGRTFQIPQPMHELTVRENLIVAQRFGTGRIDIAKVNEVLDILGLSDKGYRDAASELSLSELKALEVGKALATSPQLLLLDEVLAGLETEGKRRFLDTIRRIHERFGMAILIIEHDIETISSLCPRIAVLNFGRLIADGSPDEVFRDPEVVRSYTGETDA